MNTSSDFAAVVGMLIFGVFFAVLSLIAVVVGLLTGFWPAYLGLVVFAFLSGLGFYRAFSK